MHQPSTCSLVNLTISSSKQRTYLPILIGPTYMHIQIQRGYLLVCSTRRNVCRRTVCRRSVVDEMSVDVDELSWNRIYLRKNLLRQNGHTPKNRRRSVMIRK